MAIVVIIAAIFGISLTTTTAAVTNPGLKTVITAKGLEYFNTVGLPILKEKLQNIPIPDVTGSTSVDIIGDIDYTFSNIQLNSLEIASSDFKSGSSNGLTLSVSGVSISGSTDWKYNNHGFIHISDSGSADLSVSQASFSISVVIEKDSNGHATVSSTGCLVTIDSVSVEFHGGASWLYNLFDGTIESAIKDEMQSQLCTAISNEVNTNGDAMVESLPDTVQVDEYAEISYALLSNPVFTDNYIETELKGEFMSVANPVSDQVGPKQSFPKPTSYDKMMYVWLSEYVANTAGKVYQNTGALQYTVTPDMIPKGVPFQLSTSSLKSIIPELYKRYGNRDLEVTVKSRNAPMMKVVPKSVDFMSMGSAAVNVIQENGTRTNVFTLGMGLNGDVRVWINSANATKQKISANFTALALNLSVIDSSIGKFSLKPLQDTVNLLVNIIGMPLINGRANQGLALPVMDGMSFTNSQITLGNGYVMIASDINYNPEFMKRRVRQMRRGQ